MPELLLNNLMLNNSNANYTSPGKIISPQTNSSPVSVSGSSQVNFNAGNEVQLKDGFKASSITGSGYFRAFISNPDFEVVFIDPNNAYPQVPIYEKLELGIKLPANIEQLIANYFNNANSPNKINPYDFNQISVEATFTGTNSHYLPYSRKVYGFFYRDYTRNNATQLWDEVQTAYHWRLRFSPEYTGNWNGSIVINFPSNSNLPSLSVNGIQFQCVNNPDPAEIGHISHDSLNNNRYLSSQKHPDKSFVPIGQNIDFTTYDGLHHPDAANSRAQNITDYIANQNNIMDLSAKGGNFFRTQLEPWSYEIEWEKLGDYDSRQYSAWELDNVMDMLYQNNSYIQLCLYNQWQFTQGYPDHEMYYNWEYIYNASNNLNIHSPYKDIPGATDPVDVFCSPCSADEYFKRKARYIIARWGYNTHILAYEISNESDQMCRLPGGTEPYVAGTLGLREKIESWHLMLARYIKSVDEGKHLVTTGYAGKIHEDSYKDPDIDITQIHSYSEDPYFNYTGQFGSRSNFRKDMYNDYKKPMVFAEIGFSAPPEGVSCTDVMFHNDMWAGLFLGGYGTGMNWWGMDINNLRSNFAGISNFISNVNFIADDYIPETNHITRNNLGCIDSDGKMDYYALKSRNGDYAIGWIHNKEYHVKNLYNVTPMPNQIPTICTPLSWNPSWNAGGYSEGIIIDDMDWYQDYKIHWYNSRTGGYLSTSFATSGDCPASPGRLKIPAPGLDYNTPDLAFKVEKNNASHWRTGKAEVFSNEKPLDKKLADGTKLYPVPVTDVVTVEMPESTGNTTIEITDLLGRVLLSKSYNSISKETIDLSTLHSGFYIVRIIENGSIKSSTKITKL